MDEKTADFIERMGLALESEGLPRIAGRIFGLLLVSEDCQSLDQLAADPVAGGGVHTGAVPRRAHRPVVPGIRRHHRSSDPGFGRGIAHAHSHAVQPLAPAPPAGRAAWPPVYRHRAWLDAWQKRLARRTVVEPRRGLPEPGASGPEAAGATG